MQEQLPNCLSLVNSGSLHHTGQAPETPSGEMDCTTWDLAVAGGKLLIPSLSIIVDLL